MRHHGICHCTCESSWINVNSWQQFSPQFSQYLIQGNMRHQAVNLFISNHKQMLQMQFSLVLQGINSVQCVVLQTCMPNLGLATVVLCQNRSDVSWLHEVTKLGLIQLYQVQLFGFLYLFWLLVLSLPYHRQAVGWKDALWRVRPLLFPVTPGETIHV